MMPLSESVSTLGAAALEGASLMWMELAMMLAAALIYLVFAGNSLSASTGKKKQLDLHKSTKDEKGICHEDESRYRDLLQTWQRAKASAQTSQVDLSSVVEAMQKLGKTTADIASELKAALDSDIAFLPKIAGLAAALLRDDASGLLKAIIWLLEESGSPPDVSVYSGLMSALLRRRDFVGVSAAASKLGDEALTPKMRTMLAMAAAQRGLLDEALGHIRQLPVPADGVKSAVTSTAAAQVLGLAAKDGRVAAAVEELKRIGAPLEARQLSDLLALPEIRRRNDSARRDLLKAAVDLHVDKGQVYYQALALVIAHDSDGPGLRTLLKDLEADVASSSSTVIVTEGLALALLEACRALRAVNTPNLAGRVLELHRPACAGAPGGKVISAVCLTIVICERASAACDFYELEMAAKSILPDATLTALLLKAAAHIGRSTLAQRLTEHASSQSFRTGYPGQQGGANADLSRHATMIKAYARERKLSSAKAVFDQLLASGATLNPVIYNCILDAMVQCNDDEGALRQFEEMKELGFIDVVSYNTMLKCLLHKGKTEEARALVEEMTARGLQPSKVTYNELLHSNVQAKDRRGTWLVIDEMHAAGVKANSVTCSILLKSLTPQSQTADVKRIMDTIDEVEETIDEVLFASVIEACIRIKQLDLLSDLMRRYRQKGSFVNLSAPTYGSMIKAYGQAADIVRVWELWNEMEERCVKPTAITLGCMTEALVINNQAEGAWNLLQKESSCEDRRGCVNTVIYSTVLKGFAFTKQLDRVFAVYKEMRSNDIPCNTITYNTMLDACAKCCAMDRASALLVDMKESSVEPDIITYSTIVKGYCVEGDVDRAFHVLEEMKSDAKFAPDEIMYNSILDGCAKQHRVEEALKVLDEMDGAGINPSNYTLSILVKLLGHARRLGQAFRMVEDLSKKNNFRPNVQVYTCLVQACILNRRLDKALALYDTMVADVGCKVDEKFFAVLARGCLQMHQPLKAVEVVRAAYQLPGHSLAAPARSTPYAIGIDSKVLEEVATRLQGAGQQEQQALAALSAELLQRHNVVVSSGGRGYGAPPRSYGAPRGYGGGRR